MSGRPATGSTAPQSLRVEILKELQQLIDSREARDRLDRGPLAESKGKEHWLLHLLVRSQEFTIAHIDTLVGTAYSNLIARLQALEDRGAHLEQLETSFEADLRSRFEAIESGITQRVERGFEEAGTRLSDSLSASMGKNLDEKWRPIGDAAEAFAQNSRQIVKDVADTYRVATQTRLLLSENARRIADLGRDIVALEESLKLVVQRTIEESLRPLEDRVAVIESHSGIAPPANNRAPPGTPPSSATPA